ncbi:antirestriction protein ArdA [Clostridioides difficile]|nr:antirestriction protein ArdA [Clostridioides difficile]
MNELRVLIEAKQPADSEKCSAWFTLPIDEEELEEALGIEADSENYRIVEKDVPFVDDVGEDTTIDRLNDLYDMYEDLPSELQDEYSELMCHFSSLDELHEHRYDITHYPDCMNMTDIARRWLAENPAFHSLSEDCVRYFDFEAYGKYLDDNGTFVETDSGIYELP